MVKKSDRLSSGTGFIKNNWQVIYAVILIILIPITMMINTIFVVDRFRTTVDVEMQRTALLIGKMFNVTSQHVFDDNEALQNQIEQVASVIPEIVSMDILAPKDGDFIVIASLYKDGINRPAHGRQNILAWYDEQAIAYLTQNPRSAASDIKLTPEEVRKDNRYWGVVIPLTDENGEKKYLMSAKLSLEIIDDLVASNLFWSYIWLAITVLIVILLLGSNTRLFQYAVLFKKMKEVDKMKDDFISMASHELRAPITAIRGYLSLFLEDTFGKLDDKQRKVMKTTFSITGHLNTLIEDLLDVSRIEQGRIKFDTEKINVEDVIEEVINHLKFEAEKKKLQFEYHRPEQSLPKINIDPLRLKQILINLCSNAIKYTPSGSVIINSFIDEQTNIVEIKITDTGIGMTAEQREKLFSKFYRIKTEQTRDIPGSGLGLWITKRLVEMMGGKIYIDSIEKVGTQIGIRFPQANPKIKDHFSERPIDEPPSDTYSDKADNRDENNLKDL